MIPEHMYSSVFLPCWVCLSVGQILFHTIEPLFPGVLAAKSSSQYLRKKELVLTYCCLILNCQWASILAGLLMRIQIIFQQKMTSKKFSFGQWPLQKSQADCQIRQEKRIFVRIGRISNPAQLFKLGIQDMQIDGHADYATSNDFHADCTGKKSNWLIINLLFFVQFDIQIF